MQGFVILLALSTSGLICAISLVGLFTVRTRTEQRCVLLVMAMSLAVSLVAIGRWRETSDLDILSWWLAILALPALWSNRQAAPLAEVVDTSISVEGAIDG